MTELSRTVRRTPAPLPMPFQPMAQAIAGPRRVMLSTDGASRRALRSVGKVAATTGDTIHLDHSAVPRVRLDHVVAHELTHIAHPSPAPRFFDDIDDSPEERRAEKVAHVMASSPLAPSSKVDRPAGAPERIRRTPADRAPAPNSGGMSATALAASLTRSQQTTAASTTKSGTNDVVRRSASPGGAAAASPNVQADAGAGSIQRRSANATDTADSSTTTIDLGNQTADEWFREQLAANLQPLLRMIEDRMIVELERRGGRTWRSS